jgi:uncharacterized Ntn-hydrolase superfamily protein
MTYSIVARDERTGQLGVAVQTCMFAVGAIVPWARPGVGVVATQAFAEAAYGPRCLDALAAGASAAEALETAREADPMAALRQVGVVGADGSAAAFTGDLCVDHTGHIEGDGFTVQANMMASADVWPAMASAFGQADGSLAHRLVAALAAADAAGGDARGRMSAALIVVAGTLPSSPGTGRVVDLRVDRSDDPVGDLTRLVHAAGGYSDLERAVDQLYGGDPAAALASLDHALAAMPDEENFLFLRAGALAASGKWDEGVAVIRSLVAARPTWEIVVRGFATRGLMTLPEGITVDDVLG